jgi:hypothetical protein
MKRIVVIADISWAIGRIHKDIEAELKGEYEFKYHDSAEFCMDVFRKDFTESDICLTTLNVHKSIIELFKTPAEQSKLVIVCHGHSEIVKSIIWSEHITYGAVSDVLKSFFPLFTHIVPNGVNASLFTRKPCFGHVDTLGWCGASRTPAKRVDWSYKIARGACLPVSIASSLPFDALKRWYHSIDIMIVTSGPESYVETGPLPPFEAIASGVVVIGTPVGNFRHVPGPKFNTIEEATIILNKLKANPDEVKRLAEEQYTWVMENWTYKTLVGAWRTMFETAIQKNVLYQ